MLTSRFLVWALAAIPLGHGTSAMPAQSYPHKPVRMLTAAPGGSADFLTRIIAQGLTSSFGQQVVVDNRGSTGGIIAAQIVASAPPDGYTLLSYSNTIWVTPLLRKNVPYDPVKDLAPITLPVSSPLVVVVHPSIPVKSVKELIDLAKSKPGYLNYGSPGSGAPTQISAELFKSMAGVNIVSVPYKGAGPALNALIAAEVQLMFATAGGVTPHMKAGRLRAVAVTSAQPSVLLPGLPTVAASLPGYESVASYGVFAPARTPAAVIERLNHEIVKALNSAETKERLYGAGVEIVGSSPEQLMATMKSEMNKIGKLIKDAGIHVK